MGVRSCFVVLVVCAGACGGRSVALEPAARDESDAGVPVVDDSAEECGSLYEHECPEGSHCFGSTACDAIWTCRAGVAPCSAAAPWAVCGCDGFIGSVAAGCMDRHAWRLDYGAPVERGAPCDATRTEPPDRVELRFTLRAVSERTTLHIALPDGTRAVHDVSPSGAGELVVTNVAFQTTIHPRILADRDGDSRCSDGVDRSGSVGPQRFDALAMTFHYELVWDDLGRTCTWWD